MHPGSLGKYEPAREGARRRHPQKQANVQKVTRQLQATRLSELAGGCEHPGPQELGRVDRRRHPRGEHSGAHGAHTARTGLGQHLSDGSLAT